MYKYIKCIAPVVLIFTVISSCKKDQAVINEYSALLTLVNATSNQANLITNFTGADINFAEEIKLNIQPYNYSNGLTLSAFRSYGMLVGKLSSLKVFDISDTLDPVFDRAINFQHSDNYTLYIAGQIGAIDTILIKENIPVRSDSTFGVRFINMSSTAGPISINLSGQEPGAEVASLTYKELTGFKTYPAGAANNAYTFECRDAITGDLLANYEFNPFFNFVPRFNNVTFVLRGVRAGNPALELSRINNY